MDDPSLKHDMRLIDRSDIAAALGLLTRLPVIVDTDKAMARGAYAAWAYPLVGAILGAILAAVASLLTWVGLPAGIAAGLVLACAVILTGAMHEDGLADSTDGLWGGWTKTRRLEIMNDSHIGVYGVCAIALALLMRWLGLLTLISFGLHWMALIAIGAISRAAMVAMMATLPNARDGGLSKHVGRPPTRTAWLALAIATVVAFGAGHLVLILSAGVATLVCMSIAKAKIGGQTGDILGATQQVTEIACLLTVIAMFG